MCVWLKYIINYAIKIKLCAFSCGCYTVMRQKSHHANDWLDKRRVIVIHQALVTRLKPSGSQSPVNRTRNVRASPIASAETDRDVVCLITGHRRRRHLVSNHSLVVCMGLSVSSTHAPMLRSALAACDGGTAKKTER